VIKIIKYFCLLSVILASKPLLASPNWIYQTGPINALMDGLFAGTTTCQDLLAHGDIGLGTFDELNGEMIVLDRQVYAARESGRVEHVEQCTTPFAMVGTFSSAAKSLNWQSMDYQQVEANLDQQLKSRNDIVLIKVAGTFRKLTVRVAPRQKPPFPKLTEAVKNQPIFNFENIKGVMVGFRFPAYLNSINVPGYHLHFISDDHLHAGHVFSFHMQSGHVTFDEARGLQLAIPTDPSFQTANLNPVSEDAVNQVEKQRSK